MYLLNYLVGDCHVVRQLLENLVLGEGGVPVRQLLRRLQLGDQLLRVHVDLGADAVDLLAWKRR